MRRALLLACASMTMIGHASYGQSFLSAKSMGLGASLTAITDTRAFDVNAAGLTGIRDWDLHAAGYWTTGGSGSGAVFQGIALGKRFLDLHAAAFQYAPGQEIAFVFPTRVDLGGTGTASSDRRVEYSEHFSLAYALRPTEGLSFALAGRGRSERVTDTEYELISIDTTTFIAATGRSYEGSSWAADLSALWAGDGPVTATAIARNLLIVRTGELPQDLRELELSAYLRGEFGVRYTPAPFVRLGLDAATDRTGAVGIEALPGSGFALRAGGYCSEAESPFFYAVSAGIGWTFEFVDIDVGYIRFLNQTGRTGSIAVTDFDPGRITTIQLNPYTGDRLAISLKTMLGNVRDRLVQIRNVEMLESVYPSSAGLYAYQPIGRVMVENVSPRPVYTRARFMVEQFMDEPTESGSVHLLPGESATIPLMAVFNEQVKRVPGVLVKDGTVTVSATPAETYDDRRQTRVVFRGRNDWDGNALSLRYFVTPNDPAVIRYARDILLERQDSLAGTPADLQRFRKVEVIMHAFAGKLTYVSDPKQSADYVQYPAETLDLRSGDCDDMTVCFSSLLNSVGISTAFVDVVPPGRPQESHIYLLVDTGLGPEYASAVSTNPRRYVVRGNGVGQESVWIPIETTVIRRGFAEAWADGAQRYLDDVELGLGVAKGWVRIVDVY